MVILGKYFNSFIIIGDTSNSESILSPGNECDLLVHETTFDKTMEDRAIISGHSTTIMAGEFAKKIKAKMLIITHVNLFYNYNYSLSFHNGIQYHTKVL